MRKVSEYHKDRTKYYRGEFIIGVPLKDERGGLLVPLSIWEIEGSLARYIKLMDKESRFNVPVRLFKIIEMKKGER